MKTLSERIFRAYRILRNHSRRWHNSDQHDLNVGAIAYWWKLDVGVVESAIKETEAG